MDLRPAAHIVFRRIDVAAGMEAHMDAPHDLARTAGRVVLLENLHRELHVLLEARRRAHDKVSAIQFQTEVDDGVGSEQHGVSLV
jgi:hypothetical protein